MRKHIYSLKFLLCAKTSFLALLTITCLLGDVKAQTIFTEDFEGVATTALLPIGGWTQVDVVSGNTLWAIGNPSCAITGKSLFLCRGSLANLCDYAVNPDNRIAYKTFSASGYATLLLNFSWKSIGNAADYGKVAYSTNGTSWTDLPTTYNLQSTTQTVTNLALPAALDNAATVYLGFRWINDGATKNIPGFVVDNISVTATAIPGCNPPTGLTASSITNNSATVGWTAPASPPANGYEYVVSTSNITPGGSGTPAAGTSVPVSGLSANTTYYLFVRSMCTSLTSSWTPSYSFMTLCTLITTVPFSEGFNVVGTTPPSCWTLALVSNTQNWTFAANDGSSIFTPHTGAGMAVKNVQAAASQALLISPPFNLNAQPTQGVRINVWIYRNSLGVANDRVKFYVNTTPNLTGAPTTLLDVQTLITGIPVVPVAGWYNYTADIPLSFNTAATFYIIAEGTTTGNANSRSVGIDDFLVENLPTCLPPTGLTATGVTGSGATISWTAPASPPANGYEYVVSTVSTTPSGSGTPTGATSVAVSLSSSTTYYLYVRSICGGIDGNSSWAGPYSFSTPCGNATLPYSEGFNSATIPLCWSFQYITGTADIDYVTSSNNPTTLPQEGTHYVFWNSFSIANNRETRLVSKAITTTGTPSVDALFYWNNDNNTAYVTGQYATEGVTVQYSLNGSTWIDVQFVPRHDGTLPAGTNQWKLKTITLPSGAGNQPTVYVGFKFHSGFGDNCSMDNLTIAASPPCLTPPVGGTASGPSSGCTGASLSYSVSGGSGSYQWQSSTTGVGGPFADIAGATNASYTPAAPAPGTYYIQVKRSAQYCVDANSNVITTVVGAGATTPANPENLSICPGGTGTISAVSTSTSSTPGSVIVTFNLPTQPAETNSAPGIIISTTSMAALPAGAVVTSATLALPNITANGNSWRSDVRLGLSGAAQLTAVKGTGSQDSPGTFNYTRNVNVANINVGGGTVNLLYWDYVNDNTSAIEANFHPPTSATLTINYSVGQPVTLNWYSDASGGNFQGTGIPFNPIGTSVLPNSSTPGTYSFYAEGLNGSCASPSRTLVTVTILDPPNPLASSNAPVCTGMSLTLFGSNNASGQSSGNSWSWSGPSFSSSSQNPIISGATAANAGTYTLTVTNSLGCTATSSHTVAVNPNPVLSIATQTNVSCNGVPDGSVDIDASNGTPAYLFDLDGNSTTDGIYSGLAAGTYTASVIDDNGCEATPTLSVVITEPEALTVAAGSNSPVCTGTDINLNSTPAGGTAGYSYAWTGPNGPVPAVQNPTISSATAADAGQYDLQITDDHGCIANTNHTVTVIAAPTAAISNFGNNNICLSQPATVTLAFTGTGPWTYTISGSGGPYTATTSGNPVNVNVTPTVSGTQVYTVTSIGNTTCPTGGTGSGTATVFVSTAPPTNNAGPVTPSSPEACSGTVLLINTTAIGGQNIRYSWNTGTNSGAVLYSTNIGGPFSPAPFQTTSPTVYAQFGALAGSSGYSVCLQGVNGCGSTNNKCTWVRGIVSVPGTINPAANAVACANDVKSYSCGTSAGATVYNWTLSGSATPITSGQGTQNVTVTFPAVFTSGQLCVTAALACGGSSTSAPRCMTISNTPAVPGTITGPAKVCPGATGIVFSVPLVTGATGYNWTVPAGCTITSGTNTPSITVSFPNPYTGAPPVCVSATSACGSSAAKCKTAGTSLPGQPGAMIGPTSNICNSTVQYSIPNVANATSYAWTNPAGTTINSGQGSNTILLDVGPLFTSGPLTVVASTLACTPGNSPARTITIAGKPNQPGSIIANPAIWCTGGFVNFSVATVSPLPIYNWTTSNGTITAGQGTNNIDVTWGATAAGTVNVTAGNTCGTSTVRSQPFSSGCREEGKQWAMGNGQWAVYPNPAHDKVTMSINLKESTDFTLQLMDVSGRAVLSETAAGTAGLNTYDLNVSHLSKGIYMLEVKSALDNWKTKVAVE
ncbi:MAG TPA: T9SS type A sorting domain-containing protein [Bacteroidia bacterium]|nr:T9SS type A sorting domain-containing protein [Bacteroidia bacterium]